MAKPTVKVYPSKTLYQFYQDKAHRLVKRAIKQGVITVPKSTTHLLAHHDDYSKPLDVKWVTLRQHRYIDNRVLFCKPAAQRIEKDSNLEAWANQIKAELVTEGI